MQKQAALAYAFVPFILVMKQPDLGTSLVFMAILLGMLLISGFKVRWLIDVYKRQLFCSKDSRFPSIDAFGICLRSRWYHHYGWYSSEYHC